MNENELRQLLQSNRDQTARGRRCPDDNELAGYVGQQLNSKKRKKFEAHVAGCKACLNTIGFLVASEEWPNAEAVPPNLLARARDLARSKPSAFWNWRWTMATAAACVLIVVSFIFFRSRPEPPPGEDLIAQQQQPKSPVVQPTASIERTSPAPLPIEKPKPTQAPAPSVRSATEDLSPTLLFPREGTVLTRDQLNFSWKPLAGAVSYEITIVTEDGAQVFSETTGQLQLRPGNTHLAPGKYFVKVVAHMPDGRTARSRMVKFRLAN
jgi:hypothetical protein